MSAALESLLAATLTWCAVVAAAALLAAAGYPFFRRLAAAAAPPRSAAALLLYASLPLLVGTLVICLLNFSALYSVFLPTHCHAGNCAPHAPEFATSAALGAVALAALLIAAVLLVGFPLQQLRVAMQRSRLARRLGAQGDAAADEHRFRIIDSDRPLAWCDGLLWPRVYVSRGLVEQLTAGELDIVLAHEEAHARRHDNLQRLWLNFVTRLWPRGANRLLVADFTVATELACDAAAAAAHGGNQPVARLIAMLREHAMAGGATQAAHWHAGVTASRLAALTGGPAAATATAPPVAAWAVLLLLWLAGSYAFTLVAHPLLEWLAR